MKNPHRKREIAWHTRLLEALVETDRILENRGYDEVLPLHEVIAEAEFRLRILTEGDSKTQTNRGNQT